MNKSIVVFKFWGTVHLQVVVYQEGRGGEGRGWQSREGEGRGGKGRGKEIFIGCIYSCCNKTTNSWDGVF